MTNFNLYETVKVILNKKNNLNIKFRFLDNINSRPMSLEKNPDIKGNPIKAELVTPKKKSVILFFHSIPKERLSCEFLNSWILHPMLMNSADLNNACAIKWKKQKFLNPSPNKIIIMPSCLRVERAITFLRSDSKMAQMLEISIVKIPVMKIKYKELSFIKSNKRNIKNTPAVTKVEEWTSEETGVGAAIAKGSHLEKGS